METNRGTTTTATRRVRTLIGAGAAIAAIALAGCAQDPSGDVAKGPGGPDAIQVVMHDDSFDPARLELEAGREVTVETTNEGNANHNFTVDDLDLSTGTVAPGEVMTATFTVPSGTTEFHCTYHPGMQGEIVAA